MSTEATKQQSIHYGCLVIDAQTGSVNHYVEKPSSYVSTFINCGIYICSLDVFCEIAQVFHSRELNYPNGSGQNRDHGFIEWERECLPKLAGTGSLFALPVNNWWSQIKTAGAAIFANRRFLDLYRRTHSERLANHGDEFLCKIIGDVFIHPTATIHCTAVVSILTHASRKLSMYIDIVFSVRAECINRGKCHDLSRRPSARRYYP